MARWIAAILAATWWLLTATPLIAATADTIPALAVVPTAIAHDDYMRMSERRRELEREFAHFKKVADEFSARSTANQSEAEYQELQAERRREIKVRREFNTLVNSHIIAFSAAAGLKTFAFPAVLARGEFYLLTADGRKLEGDAIAGALIDNRTKAITGPGGSTRLILPDETSFTVGANSEFVLDEFVYDPNTSRVSVKLAKGFFRWVTGKVQRRSQDFRQLKTPVMVAGPRGTDFSCTVGPDDSGEIKLYSGELELTEIKTGAVSILSAGQMVVIIHGKPGAPIPLPKE